MRIKWSVSNPKAIIIGTSLQAIPFFPFYSGGQGVAVSDRESIRECITKLSSTVQSVSQEHKDIHASISKYGRMIDKVCEKMVCGQFELEARDLLVILL